ncbi:hypothetical protein DEIPH_ctg040orf0033 [Deinococcus phoenicis]|uniref:Uncharacterized protein n=1 Tax=Deinococcus phoenicis TaxID=1476583 RepID=A0A016QNX4_9DEIO|nr:Ig-like domain-containing protein [Deinococcus phoenicis]EYB67469.1 hypothetical protein DEIPH_ctg040orf0033 [Deinococcus phoenicis]
MKKLALPFLSAALLLAACGGDPRPTADTTPPTVALQATQSGTTVNLTATATDNVGVTKVEFYRGNTLLSADTTVPYTASLPVTSADNGAVNFTARAYDAAGNQGQAGAQVTVNIPRAGTLYQGVWGWAVADASTGDIIETGAMVLVDEGDHEGRKVAVGAYTNTAQSQTGASLLGPITAAGELETIFSYDLNTEDPRAYLVAIDDDGQLEATEDGPAFFGAGALFDRATQQPNRAVDVLLLQLDDEVPAGQDAQATAKRNARALAASTLRHQFRTASGLQAQTLKTGALQQAARDILRR